MPFPYALRNKPKIIFFTDFDGTITLQDTNDTLTDNLGFGVERRRQLNQDCLEGKVSFRDTFQEMLDSINTPFFECIEYLKARIQLDPHFKTFYQWARANNVPVIVLSSGMRPIIQTLLVTLIGDVANEIEIVCNESVNRPGMFQDQEGGWTIKFHDDSGFGHDKSLAIRPYAQHIAQMPENERPTLLFAGDGVSDLSAARETDLLFAKKGRDLVTYCEREHVPYTVFEDWESIHKTTKDILEGKTNVKKVAAELPKVNGANGAH